VIGERFRQIVTNEPEPAENFDVHGHQHHPTADDPHKLADTLLDVLPVLHGEHCHRGVDRLIAKG